jgi:glycosyltransferase involved in cell wall biosynthesis
MGKVLIFFTSSYPYGTGESFIENEIEYLSRSFDRLYIVSNNCKDKQTREVPQNITLIRDSFALNLLKKLGSFFSIFDSIVLKEIKQCIIDRKFSVQTFKYLLSSFGKAKKVKQCIEDIVSKHNVNGDKLFIYTYWWLDESIGACLYKKKHADTVVVTRAHGYDLYLFRQPNSYLPFRMFTLHTLNKAYVISQHGINYLHKQLLLSSDISKKIILSKLGTKQQCEASNFVVSKSHTIASCSYIYPNKRIELIIDALMHIDDININWVHIGDFTSWVNVEYKNRIKSLLKGLENKNNIQVSFMGNINNLEIMELYRTISPSLFINVSTYEGIPVSIMEAMSLSIPVIATDVGGTSEIVNDTNGYLIAENITAKDITEIIYNYFALNEKEKVLKQEAAFETWSNHYNADKNYTTFVNDLLNA